MNLFAADLIVLAVCIAHQIAVYYFAWYLKMNMRLEELTWKSMWRENKPLAIYTIMGDLATLVFFVGLVPAAIYMFMLPVMFG